MLQSFTHADGSRLQYLYRLSERRTPLSIMGSQLGASLNSLGTILPSNPSVPFCFNVFPSNPSVPLFSKEPSFSTPWCRETPVSRKAVRLIYVVFPSLFFQPVLGWVCNCMPTEPDSCVLSNWMEYDQFSVFCIRFLLAVSFWLWIKLNNRIITKKLSVRSYFFQFKRTPKIWFANCNENVNEKM